MSSRGSGSSSAKISVVTAGGAARCVCFLRIVTREIPGEAPHSPAQAAGTPRRVDGRIHNLAQAGRIVNETIPVTAFPACHGCRAYTYCARRMTENRAAVGRSRHVTPHAMLHSAD